MSEKKEKYVVFHAEGGQGKMGMATAVIRAIKKKYPDRKIIVVTSWDGPFFNNPNVHRFYLHNEIKYFYETYIKDQDTKIFRQEVYHYEDHILQKKHLTESWCNMYNIPYDGPEPEIYINPREIEIAKDKIKPHLGKPIMLIQTNGGGVDNQYSKKSWARDIPIEIAQKVVNYFAKDYRILHVRRPEQLALENTEILNLPLRELYAVFLLSTKRLFMDSFSQHIAAGLKLPSTVCWIANKPHVYGYDMHTNITTNAKLKQEFLKFSYLEPYRIDGLVQEFPYDTVNLFDINEIITAVNNQPIVKPLY